VVHLREPVPLGKGHWPLAEQGDKVSCELASALPS